MMKYPKLVNRKSAGLLVGMAALPAVYFVQTTPYIPSALGVFHQFKNEIYLRSDLVGDFYYMGQYTDQADYVCSHEVGHWAFYKRKSAQSRDIYCDAFERTGYSPTRYGQTNCAENFAEIYAGFVEGLLEYDDSRYQHRAALVATQRFERPEEICK